MSTETAAAHPADIEMQANSTVFHQSTANSTIFIQSIQFETLAFLKWTVQLSTLDWSNNDKDKDND